MKKSKVAGSFAALAASNESHQFKDKYDCPINAIDLQHEVSTLSVPFHSILYLISITMGLLCFFSST